MMPCSTSQSIFWMQFFMPNSTVYEHLTFYYSCLRINHIATTLLNTCTHRRTPSSTRRNCPTAKTGHSRLSMHLCTLLYTRVKSILSSLFSFSLLTFQLCSLSISPHPHPSTTLSPLLLHHSYSIMTLASSMLK